MVRVGLHQVHRVTNDGREPLLILELQKGACREDDIERLEDDYKRA
jgi:mannose-6-phosphate isomerase-like protein (cupin superfamily)